LIDEMAQEELKVMGRKEENEKIILPIQEEIKK